MGEKTVNDRAPTTANADDERRRVTTTNAR
jgi:hypothetical protein